MKTKISVKIALAGAPDEWVDDVENLEQKITVLTRYRKANKQGEIRLMDEHKAAKDENDRLTKENTELKEQLNSFVDEIDLESGNGKFLTECAANCHCCQECNQFKPCAGTQQGAGCDKMCNCDDKWVDGQEGCEGEYK